MEQQHKKIPLAGPFITQKEIDYVHDAVVNGWYETYDMHIRKLEKRFAEYVGANTPSPHTAEPTRYIWRRWRYSWGLTMGSSWRIRAISPRRMRFPTWVRSVFSQTCCRIPCALIPAKLSCSSRPKQKRSWWFTLGDSPATWMPSWRLPGSISWL